MASDLTAPKAAEVEAGYPHLYRVGAYLFFGWLAFWSVMPVYALCRWLHAPDSIRGLASTIIMVVTFMALRDMTKRLAAHPSKGE